MILSIIMLNLDFIISRSHSHSSSSSSSSVEHIYHNNDYNNTLTHNDSDNVSIINISFLLFVALIFMSSLCCCTKTNNQVIMV